MSRANVERVAAILLVGLSLACGAPHTAERARDDDAIALSSSTLVRRLAPSAWLVAMHDGSGASANAVLVESEDHSVLLDTGSDESETRRVLAWARDVRAHPIAAAIVTNADADRVGGVSALVDEGVAVYATNLTARLCAARGTAIGFTPLDASSVPGVTWMLVRIEPYPEAIVAYHPASRVLYGGLFVDAADAERPSRDDPDRSGCRAAFDLVATSFPDATIVVPGRGEAGRAALLDHSRSLLAECRGDSDCVVTAEDLTACRCCPCTDTRALPRSTLDAAHAEQPSCEPRCEPDLQCPMCPSTDVLGRVRATCERGECSLAH